MEIVANVSFPKIGAEPDTRNIAKKVWNLVYSKSSPSSILYGIGARAEADLPPEINATVSPKSYNFRDFWPWFILPTLGGFMLLTAFIFFSDELSEMYIDWVCQDPKECSHASVALWALLILGIVLLLISVVQFCRVRIIRRRRLKLQWRKGDNDEGFVLEIKAGTSVVDPPDIVGHVTHLWP